MQGQEFKIIWWFYQTFSCSLGCKAESIVAYKDVLYSKRDQLGFKAPAAPLYSNMSQVSPTPHKMYFLR